MKTRSEHIVQTFKPLRITIDIDDPRDMDTVAGLLRFALHGGYMLDTRGQTVIRDLLAAFTRL